ncbi:hypothetical protein MTO96_033644 [Rhipicephalus appendiculatus]
MISRLVLQDITVFRLQFFDGVASWPGSNHDSRIFDNSRARVRYELCDVTGLLLGDMGYACRHYLMIPLKDPKTQKNSGERALVDTEGGYRARRRVIREYFSR